MRDSQEHYQVLQHKFIDFMQGKKGFLAELISMGVNTPQNEHGDTLMHAAVRYGATKIDGMKYIIHHLISNKADIDARNVSGETPLCQAARYGNSHAVELLLSQNARTDITYKHDNVEGYTLGHSAVLGRNTSIILELSFSKKGIKFNTPDANGDTPMHLAASLDHSNVVLRVLGQINEDDEVNRPNVSGETPIFNAAKSGNVFAVQELIHMKADVNYVAREGKTALHDAILSYSVSRSPFGSFFENADGHEERYISVVKELISAGANPDKLYRMSFNAVDLALKFGCHYMADQIKQHCSKIKERESEASKIMQLDSAGAKSSSLEQPPTPEQAEEALSSRI